MDKDISILTFDFVSGSLLSHEMFIKSKYAQIAQDNKKKSIALKVDESSEETSDEDLAMLAKKFKKFYKKGLKNKKFSKKFSHQKSHHFVQKAMIWLQQTRTY